MNSSKFISNNNITTFVFVSYPRRNDYPVIQPTSERENLLTVPTEKVQIKNYLMQFHYPME